MSPDGATIEILARGFRAANGVCVEPDGTTVTLDVEGFGSTRSYSLAWRLEAAAGIPASGTLHGTVH